MISRKIALLFLTLGLFVAVQAQSPRTLPVAYNSGIPVNYIRTWDAVKPVTSPNDLVINTGVTVAKMSTQYLDGLGRPIQTVVKKGALITDPGNPSSSGNAVDMISMTEYDEFGRERFSYLPTPSTITSINTVTDNGLFKRDPFQQQQDFYNIYLNDQTGEVTASKNWAYMQTNFEASPLNRTIEHFAPGVSWVGTEAQTLETNRRSVKTKYWTNTTNDEVRIWNVTLNVTIGGFSTYVSPGAYPMGALNKNVAVDEHNKQVIEFRDKDEKLILRKVQVSGPGDTGLGTGHTADWLCTYYLYDDLGNLRCMIQPKGVAVIKSDWLLTNTTILNELCFRYEYDERNRMIVKKVPGAGEVYMVYDSRDRLVMMQDAKMRTAAPYAKWMVTIYDNLNRPVMTGLMTNNTIIGGIANRTFAQHCAAASPTPIPGIFADYPFNSATVPSATNWELLTQTFFDNYEWLSSHGNPFVSTRNTTHDGYLIASSNSTYPYPQAVVQSSAIKGLVTGAKVKVLGSSIYLYEINYYDEKGRVIQVINQNITGGNEYLTTQYDFSGKPVIQISLTEANFASTRSDLVRTAFEYDELGRLIGTKKTPYAKVGGTWKGGIQNDILRQEYDALGQLKKKKLAPSYKSGVGIETQKFDYNIRGWLLGANRDYLRNTGDASYRSSYFGFELSYDKSQSLGGTSYFHPLQYNGNILGIVWKSAGDQVRRKYDFRYDGVNRLGIADFNQNTSAASGGNYINTEMDFSVSGNSAANNWFIPYDENGNILEMTHKGFVIGLAPVPIDRLGYTYNLNSNKLLKVTDAVTADYKLGDFKDGTNTGDNDYAYDANGSVINDHNKNIGNQSNVGIVYNHLNLPSDIAFRSSYTNNAVKGTIVYIYDAKGKKLRKTTVENNVTVNGYTTNITTIASYIGESLYESKEYSHPSLVSMNYTGKFQFIEMEEGRIRFRNGDETFQYDYMLKDHLGNVRMILTDEQKQDMYPAATMETATITSEQNYYGNLNNTQYNKPSWFNDPLYSTNGKVAQIKNASGIQKIGPNIVLKVMAGDSYNLRVASGWSSSSTASNNSTNVLVDLLTIVSSGVAGASSGKVVASDLQATSSGLNAGLFSFLGTQSTVDPKPKAYINWILLDEQFKLVPEGCGFEQVGASGTTTIHSRTNVNVSKSGYLYIYTSNEATNIDVFFDNLQVTHNRGPIQEETHYYPFGLTMAGISAKVFQSLSPDCGCPTNKIGFNGNEIQSKEFSDGVGLDMYDFGSRTYNQQIGRFIQIDPLTEAGSQESLTPYHFSGNNPTTFNDPNGKCPWCIGFIVGAAVDYATQVSGNLLNGKSLGESLTQVDGNQIFVSGVAGGLTSGASVFIPKTVVGNVAKEIATTSVDVLESVAKQYNDGNKQGKGFAESVSVSQTVSDVVANKIGGKVMDNVNANSIKSAEQKLDRAQRVAANDPSSSGRANAVSTAENNVLIANGSKQAASGAAGNLIQATSNTFILTPSTSNGYYRNISKSAVDNTYVKKPLIRL